MTNVLLLPEETRKNHRMVQNALPGFMFSLLFESLKKLGWEVRQDLHELADKCSAAALAHAVGPQQSELAKIVERDGYEALKNAGTSNVRLLIGGLARWVVKARDQGRPVNNDAVIVGLGICAEIDDGVTDWGKPNQLNPIMAKIDNDLLRLGYFKTEGVEVTG